MKYVRTFGCLSYEYIPQRKRCEKFSKTSAECVLLSHNDGMVTLVNVSTGKSTVTKHAVFDDSVFCVKRRESQEACDKKFILLTANLWRKRKTCFQSQMMRTADMSP